MLERKEFISNRQKTYLAVRATGPEVYAERRVLMGSSTQGTLRDIDLAAPVEWILHLN